MGDGWLQNEGWQAWEKHEKEQRSGSGSTWSGRQNEPGEATGFDSMIGFLMEQYDKAHNNGTLTPQQSITINSKIALLHLKGLENPNLKENKEINFFAAQAYAQAATQTYEKLPSEELGSVNNARQTYEQLTKALMKSETYNQMLRSGEHPLQ